jgi:hypothetical protein
MLRPRSIVVSVAAIAAAALCVEGARTPPRAKSDSLRTPQAITSEILALERLLDEAESHHRVPAVGELIDDDYWGITVQGSIITKRDVLAAVSGTEEVSSQTSDQDVRVMENAAVYTALVTDRGTVQKTGQPYTLTTRVMDVWQKRGRAWRLVNDQATAVTLNHSNTN